MPEYSYFGSSRDANENGEQCGIFIRRDRFEVVDSGQFWLSQTPDVKFSKSWDSSLPRVAAWVRIKDKHSDSRELLFANTHFDHLGVEARKRSAALLRQQLTTLASGLPTIVTGDFNCDEGSEPWMELLNDTTLKDSLREVLPERRNNEGTFHGFSGKPGTARIDWILSSKHLVAIDSTIDRTHDDGRFPSDHFPVTATFRWKR